MSFPPGGARGRSDSEFRRLNDYPSGAVASSVTGMAVLDPDSPRYADVATEAGVSVTTVGRILRGASEPVAESTRVAITEAYEKLGGDPLDIPMPGTLVRWPTPKTGPRTDDELREQRRIERANTRRVSKLVDLAEQAGLTRSDLEAWCTEHVGGPHPWERNLPKLWSQRGHAAHRRLLRQWVVDQLPDGVVVDGPRVYSIPCQRCGETWEAPSPTTKYDPECAELVAAEHRAEVEARTYERTCRECGVEFEAAYPATRYCDDHRPSKGTD